MLGTIFYAVWGCAITAATLFVGITMKVDAESSEDANKVVELPPIYSQPQLLVAPVVYGQKSKGYVFSNVALEMDAKVRAQTRVSLQMIMQDSYLALIVGNPEFAFPEKPHFELLQFKAGLKAKINETIGDELVKAIYVSGVNFLGSGEARTKQTLRTVWLQRPADEPEEKPAKKSKQ